MSLYPDSKIFTPEIHLHKNLHTNIHSSFIHNCQKLETTQMSFNYLLNKGTVVHPYNGMPLTSTKKQSIGTHSNEGDSEMSYNDSSRTVRFCSCGILETANLWGWEQVSGCQGRRMWVGCDSQTPASSLWQGLHNYVFVKSCKTGHLEKWNFNVCKIWNTWYKKEVFLWMFFCSLGFVSLRWIKCYLFSTS